MVSLILCFPSRSRCAPKNAFNKAHDISGTQSPPQAKWCIFKSRCPTFCKRRQTGIREWAHLISFIVRFQTILCSFGSLCVCLVYFDGSYIFELVYVFCSATTHSDLVLRAVNAGIPYRVIHNASIMNAVGCCGLQVRLLPQTYSKKPEAIFLFRGPIISHLLPCSSLLQPAMEVIK